MAKAQTVDEYLDTLEGPARSRLEELRSLCQECVPEASEAIKWGSPAYVHPSGTILLILDFFKNHSNVIFTPSTKDAFAQDLTGFDTGKGSVKLPYDKPVPSPLLRKMIKYRVHEHVEHGVKWM
ncbi:Uncharacterized conserved protein YdhG, YjbR/CyaY-like superfamily, DUF1801 family [Micrococcales bacterium KH10]|nr:Uncharacterized conserved protein YdhG, YjbR/CyaY-like superfamily, DUF1801 family [Micrococcales bacterium KH10]